MQKYLIIALCSISLIIQAELSPKAKKLFEAAQAGDVTFLQQARDDGEDLSVQDKDGNTLVHIAALHGHTEAIDILTKPYEWEWYEYLWRWLTDNVLPSLETQNKEGDTPLHCAAEKGHEKVIDYLLTKKVNICIKNKQNLAPIYAAIKQGRIDILIQFLNRDQENVEDILKLRLNGKNILTQAIEYNHPEFIKRLLTYKTLINELDDHGKAPIHYAAALQNKEALELLLQHGVDSNMKDKKGNTPVCYVYGNKFKEGITLLKKYNANLDIKDNCGETLLHKSVNNKDLEAFQELLESKANINIQDSQGRTVLHLATLHYPEIIDLILSYKPTMHLKTKDGLTPFMLACEKGLLTTAQKMERLSDIDAVDNAGNTAFMRAITHKDNGTCAYLLNNGARVDTINNDGNSVLHIATLSRNTSIIQSLLRTNPTVWLLINKTNKKGNTPLHIAAQLLQDKDINLECAKLLLEAKAHPNMHNNDGLTPLHYAAMNGHKAFINTLIAYDPSCITQLTKYKENSALSLAIKDKQFNCISLLKHPQIINKKNKDGYTPLMLGINAGLKENGLQELIASGANVMKKDSEENNCLHMAITCGNSAAFKLFIRYQGLIDQKNKKGNAPIHRVMHNGDIEQLKELLNAGCDVNIQDAQGKVPLTYAAEKNNKEMLDYLIAYRASLNKKDYNGFTPLANATKAGSLNCMKRLVEAGASKEGAPNGDSLLHIAARSGDTEKIRYIESIGFSRDMRNHAQQTPMMVAAEEGLTAATKALIRDCDFANGDVAKAARLASNNLQFIVGIELEAQIKYRKEECDSLNNQQVKIHNLKEHNKLHNDMLRQQAIKDYAKFAYPYMPAVWAKRYSFEEIWSMSEGQRTVLKTQLDAIEITERQQHEQLTSKLNGIKQQQEEEVKYARACEHTINTQDIVHAQIRENKKRSKQLIREMQQLKDQGIPLPFEDYRYVPSECDQKIYAKEAIYTLNDQERTKYIRTLSQCQSYESQEKNKLDYRLNATKNYINNQNTKQVYTPQQQKSPQTNIQFPQIPQMPQTNKPSAPPMQQAPQPAGGLAQLRVYGAQEECNICNQKNGQQDENGRGVVEVHRSPCPTCKKGSGRICQFCIPVQKQCPFCNINPLNDFAPYVEVKA